MVYARYIPQQYIYMEYTWYIPTIYLVGVPDDSCGTAFPKEGALGDHEVTQARLTRLHPSAPFHPSPLPAFALNTALPPSSKWYKYWRRVLCHLNWN